MDYVEWIPERISELRIQKGISARDMSLSLGQSESYINKIENRRTLPSMLGFLYICDFFCISPKEFFNAKSSSPQKVNALLADIEKLSSTQIDHIHQIVIDIAENNR